MASASASGSSDCGVNETFSAMTLIGGQKKEDKAKVNEPVGPMTLIEGLTEDRKSFYVKIGPEYQAVSFTMDPAIVQFEPKDSLDSLVDDRRIDLDLLAQVFKKCPNIENLKFYGISIPRGLVKLIANKCPKLRNLELNPYDTPGDRDRALVWQVREVKLLVVKCHELRTLIIRDPSTDIFRFMRTQGCVFDKVDRNFFFETPKLDVNYKMAYHNIHGKSINNFQFFVFPFPLP